MPEEASAGPVKGISVPAHVVPPPSTVSPQAQAFLGQRMEADNELPDVNDKPAWQAMIDQANAWLTAQMVEGAQAFPIDLVTHERERCPVYEVVPKSLAPADEDLALLYIHGGAFIHGAGVAGAYMGAPLTCISGMRAFCVDYRMPPYYPAFASGFQFEMEAIPASLRDLTKMAHCGVEKA